jgi:hypothetical protein
MKMKLGTHIKLNDGREATVVYNGLDGVGIKWGIHYPTREEFINPETGQMCQPLVAEPPMPDDWDWKPEAMLRNPYPSADIPCVGEKYTIIALG